MKNILVILLFALIAGCSIKPTVINYKMDRLSYDYITKDIAVLLKNLYSPAQNKIVYYDKVNKKFTESLENNLRAVGYSVRSINHEKANINKNEFFINLIIDRIKDTAEEKKIKKINNDTTNTIRVSVLIDDKMYSRLYLIHKTYEVIPISRWLENDIIKDL